MLEGDYTQSEKCLNDSLLLAEEHGHDALKYKIEKDLQELKKDAENWLKAFQQNASLSRRLEMLEIENYFKDVKKLFGT